MIARKPYLFDNLTIPRFSCPQYGIKYRSKFMQRQGMICVRHVLSELWLMKFCVWRSVISEDAWQAKGFHSVP